MANNTSRKMIAERRKRARRQKQRNFAIGAVLVLSASAALFVVVQNRISIAQKYTEIDPNKSKGDLDAPIQIVEYGDFQ
jgi:hypothetical protein